MELKHEIKFDWITEQDFRDYLAEDGGDIYEVATRLLPGSFHDILGIWLNIPVEFQGDGETEEDPCARINYKSMVNDIHNYYLSRLLDVQEEVQRR